MSVSRRARSSGFTLIELMMVVAILGILAAIAVPRYISYVYKSKTTEAIGFLAEIKARQESYRADFGQYCNVSGTLSNTSWNPSGTPSNVPQAWDTASTIGKNWTQLGATPPGGRVLFRYLTVAGAPGSNPSGSGWSSDLGYNGSDFWFVSRAQGDLNGDGVVVNIESYSAASGLYIDQPSGWQ